MVGMRANTYICMCSGMVVAGENVERKQVDSYQFLSALSSPSSMQVITLDLCWTKPVGLLSSFTASPFLLPTLVLTSWNLSFLSSYLAKFTLLTIIHDPPLSVRTLDLVLTSLTSCQYLAPITHHRYGRVSCQAPGCLLSALVVCSTLRMFFIITFSGPSWLLTAVRFWMLFPWLFLLHFLAWSYHLYIEARFIFIKKAPT